MTRTAAPVTADTGLREHILRLKQERRAVILAHNYQPGDVQDIADFVGDSLELSRQAAATDAEVIVFCGVHFMAETAAMLSPQRAVLLPDLEAGCPLSECATAEQVRARRAELPGVPAVCYVNTAAEVKAECDICCTSANAVRVVESLPEDRVLFLPDRNLAAWVQTQTTKQIIPWPGVCPTHLFVQARDIERLRREYPEAEVMVHPECTPDVIALADHALGTGGMIRLARESPARTFIVGTEVGIIHRLQKEAPDKTFIPASKRIVCPNMKRITLEKVLWALEDRRYRITVPDEIRARAVRAIERMLAVR